MISLKKIIALLIFIYSSSAFSIPFDQDPGADGIVSIEAENFDSNTPQGTHAWSATATPTGFSGSGAMEATPNNSTNINTGYATTSPQLNYAVNFVKTGIHYVWIRGAGPSAFDDSLHVGLNGAEITSSDRISFFTPDWSWSNNTMGVAVATINVTTLGTHTLNIWMREDGMKVDKLLLTTNAGFSPTGNGPVESPRGGGANVPPVANNDADSTAVDTAVIINVLSNDTDADGTLDPSTVIVASPAGFGAAVANVDGTITYTPGAGYSGPDSFTYTVQDDLGATSNVATVNIMVDRKSVG